MTATILTTLLTGLIGIFLAGITYWFTKKRERDAELRKVKLEYYKEFVLSLSGIMEGEDSPEGHRAFSRTSNNLMLIAPQHVLVALHAYRSELDLDEAKRNDVRETQLFSKLLYEIRRDLQISPHDQEGVFKVNLWASGVKQDS